MAGLDRNAKHLPLHFVEECRHDLGELIGLLLEEIVGSVLNNNELRIGEDGDIGTAGRFTVQILGAVDDQNRSIDLSQCRAVVMALPHIASPPGLDFYICLPEAIPNSRLARLQKANQIKTRLGLSLPLLLADPQRLAYGTMAYLQIGFLYTLTVIGLAATCPATALRRELPT